MQEELLSKDKDANLQIYAVWFTMYPGDAPDRWPATALPDRRVLHYWDEEKEVGNWYATRLDAMRDTLAPDSKGVEPPTLWDAYLVYGPEARWDDTPTGLRRWGRTVLHTKDALREAVEKLNGGSK